VEVAFLPARHASDQIQVTDMSAQAELATQLQLKIVDLQAQQARLSTDLAQARADADTHRRAADLAAAALQAAQAKMGKLTEQHLSHEDEISQLHTKLRAAHAATADAEARLARATADAEARLARAIADHRRESEQLTAQIQRVEDDLSQAQAMAGDGMRSLQLEQGNAHRERAEAVQALQAAKAELQLRDQALTTLKAQMTSLQEEYHRAQSAARTQQQQAQDSLRLQHQAELQHAQAQAAAARAECVVMREELSGFTGQQPLHEADKELLRRELAAARAALTREQLAAVAMCQA
jgi:golgin subfamily B member 1